MLSELGKLAEAAEGILEKGAEVPEVAGRIPTMEELQGRMKEAFPPPPGGKFDEVPNPQYEYRPREIALEDGTVVRLPDGPGPVRNTNAGEKDVQKTDDRGEIYSKDGKLQPNDTYVLNGNTYETDSSGRIKAVDAEPKLSPENERDNAAQKEAGGKDRQESDQGGHIVGRDLGGDGGEGNLVAMDSRINQSDYKRMENVIKRDLAEGKQVTTHTEITYSGDSERPDIIKTTKIADGRETVYTFDNNINGALRERPREIGGEDAAEAVNSVLDETGGEVSSIKEEYDENRSLVKATVNITYKDADGSTQRIPVVIDKPNGGDNRE